MVTLYCERASRVASHLKETVDSIGSSIISPTATDEERPFEDRFKQAVRLAGNLVSRLKEENPSAKLIQKVSLHDTVKQSLQSLSMKILKKLLN